MCRDGWAGSGASGSGAVVGGSWQHVFAEQMPSVFFFFVVSFFSGVDCTAKKRNVLQFYL